MKGPHLVAEYMSRTPHSIGADQPLSRARAMMHEHRIRHLPVLRGGELVGIVTERDIAWFTLLEDEGREKTLVEDAMTPFPYVTTPETPLREVAMVDERRKVLGRRSSPRMTRASASSRRPTPCERSQPRSTSERCARRHGDCG